MKRTSLLICLVVWLLSLTVAYYIGSEVQSQSVAETENADTPEAAITRTAPRTAEAPAEAASESIAESPRSALEAYLDGESVAMDAALAAVPVLSAEDSRLLLADALALPTSDPNRPRLIEEMLAQLAKTSVDSVTDPELRENLRDDLIDEWAAFDPVAAGAYIESLGEGATPRLKTALVSEWAESDPVAAGCLAEQARARGPRRSPGKCRHHP